MKLWRSGRLRSGRPMLIDNCAPASCARTGTAWPLITTLGVSPPSVMGVLSRIGGPIVGETRASAGLTMRHKALRVGSTARIYVVSLEAPSCRRVAA